jgi:hypothetical protein
LHDEDAEALAETVIPVLPGWTVVSYERVENDGWTDTECVIAWRVGSRISGPEPITVDPPASDLGRLIVAAKRLVTDPFPNTWPTLEAALADRRKPKT